MQPHERIYVAIDTTDVSKALALAKALRGKVGGFKIGLEFNTAIIPRLMMLKLQGLHSVADQLLDDLEEFFRAIGSKFFYDGKFNDIPNTVAGASRALQPLSPRFFNVHANSGVAAMKEAVANQGSSQVLAVTLLTSFDEAAADATFGKEPHELVLHWAQQAQESGTDGLVCSPADLSLLNQFEDLRQMPKMTPGIRLAGAKKDDQSRIATPSGAVGAGSTWLVVGRPITEHPDGPVAGVEAIVDDLTQNS